jgi:SMODS and SLOG-associating 2TM effector domain
MSDEERPLFDVFDEDPNSLHLQFCALVGIPPSNVRKDRRPPINPNSLYGRATKRRDAQGRTYTFTALLSNTLLLTQVILGAALTGLGASESSHVLITVFGATGTIVAGLVAYLKSRGQPMRAHMFRDDLDRVVDEMENSEVMWRGIARGFHGYDEIAIEDEVSVRSEVARLTRLYDKAVRSNTSNDRKLHPIL